MTNTNVLGVGNAIVDVLTHASEEFIADQHEKYGMEKGSMTLIETKRATQLYSQIGQATEMSGGSAANTIAIIAGLGGSASFIGKVADDQLGDVFQPVHAIRFAARPQHVGLVTVVIRLPEGKNMFLSKLIAIL